MYFAKIITSYVILFFIYKIMKEHLKNKTSNSDLFNINLNINNNLDSKSYKLKKKNKKSKNDTKNDTKNNTKNPISTEQKNKEDNKNDYQIVLYKHKKKSNYNIKDIYNNFFNKKPHVINTNIDIDLLNLSKKNNKIKIEKEIIILSESKDNIKLHKNNNYILYDFVSNKKNIYKIKLKLFGKGIHNIKLILSDDKKRFVYDYADNNLTENNIEEYGFILDNNFEIDGKIYIYLLFFNDSLNDTFNDTLNDSFNNIIINNISIEIIEKPFVKEDSIIIFNVNNKYIPLYPNKTNILDYKEFTDNSNIFFI